MHFLLPLLDKFDDPIPVYFYIANDGVGNKELQTTLERCMEAWGYKFPPMSNKGKVKFIVKGRVKEPPTWVPDDWVPPEQAAAAVLGLKTSEATEFLGENLSGVDMKGDSVKFISI
jgi:hypothetical protein